MSGGGGVDSAGTSDHKESLWKNQCFFYFWKVHNEWGEEIPYLQLDTSFHGEIDVEKVYTESAPCKIRAKPAS